MNARTHTPHHVILILLGTLAAFAPTVAGELDAHLPADTMVYLQWSGRSLTFDGSKFGQMILDPDVETLVVFFRGMIEENIDDQRGQAVFEKAWNCLCIAWQHPVVLSVSDFSNKGASLAVLIDLGDDKAAFEKEFRGLLDLIPLPEGKQLTPVTVSGGNYTVLPGPKKMEPTFGYLGNVFFFTLGSDQARALLERKPGHSLQTNPKYQTRMKAVGGENVQLAVYVDVETIRAKVKEMIPVPAPASASATQPVENPADRITKAMGVDKLQAVAGTVRVVDKGMYTKIRLFTPAPHQGLLLPLTGATLSDADLAHVPGDVDMAVAINLSPKVLYDEIRRMARQIDPNADRMIAGEIAAVEQHLEMSLENDVLASLGDTWVYSVSPSQGGPLVGSMISLEVTNPEKLHAFIDKLEARLLPPAPRIPTTAPRRRRPRPGIGIMKVGDTKIHYLRTPARGLGMAFLPAWAVHENRLYVALWPQVIASALENQTPPLTKRPEYQALRKRFAPNASAMMYVNTPEIMKKLYPLQLLGGTILMNAIAGEARTTHPVPLWPGSLQSVLRYLIPSMNAVSHDVEGITFEGYGTCPSLLPTSPLITSLGVAAALPAVNRARYHAKCAVSKTRMKGLGTALEIYNAAEDGYPQDVAVLVEEGYVSSKMFTSPLSEKTAPRVKDGKFLDPVDYVYIRPKPNAPGDTLMMYEKPENYQDGKTMVLYVAGHVQEIPASQLQKLIDKATAASPDGGDMDF